jgi:hypothetical protein
MTAAGTTRTRTPAATVIGWLSLLAFLGSALLAVAHAGVEVPLLSALGPPGDDPVPVAVAIFAAGAALYAVVAAGAFAAAPWTWPLGLAVNALALASGITNYRGTASAIGIALSLLSLLFLLSPGGRRAFRRRR